MIHVFFMDMIDSQILISNIPNSPSDIGEGLGRQLVLGIWG